MKLIAVAIVTALVTASGATAAFVVTSAHIKNGTIQPIDLSAKTKRFLRGSKGARGPAGPPGPQGDRGLQGPPGIQNVSQIVSPLVQVADGAEGIAIATCATGAKLTGGGFWASHPALAAYVSQPWGEGWRVIAFNFGDTPYNMYAYALCASN